MPDSNCCIQLEVDASKEAYLSLLESQLPCVLLLPEERFRPGDYRLGIRTPASRSDFCQPCELSPHLTFCLSEKLFSRCIVAKYVNVLFLFAVASEKARKLKISTKKETRLGIHR